MLLQGDYVALQRVSPLECISPPYPAPSCVFPASKGTVSCGHRGGPSPTPGALEMVVFRREGPVWCFVSQVVYVLLRFFVFFLFYFIFFYFYLSIPLTI